MSQEIAIIDQEKTMAGVNKHIYKFYLQVVLKNIFYTKWKHYSFF